jgi:hypothetical protein
MAYTTVTDKTEHLQTVDEGVLAERRAQLEVWRIALIACALGAAVWTGFAPLADPDLPMHLAMGEWIAHHATVPYVEPFAWTRPGAPYYAYSWLAQITFYEALRLVGPLGLHLLASAAGAAAVLAGAAAGRALGSRGLATTLLGALNAFVAMESTPFLRPQLFMFVLLPLAWVFASHLSEDGAFNRRAALGLWIVSAIAANVHITFPATAAALAIPIVRWRRGTRTAMAIAIAAIALGWLCSPYAAMWFDVFRLNWGDNVMTTRLSPAGELAPGFFVSPIVGLALAALPWLARADAMTPIGRVVFGALWLAGLAVFARYFKGLGPWWWCSMPLAVAALRHLAPPSSRRTAIAFAALPPAALIALSITNVRLYAALRGYEGDVSSRTLPSIKSFASEPAARWLSSNLRPGFHGRLLTSFNYGSYLKWRVPGLSESIDTRNVFPDSAALPDVPSLKARAHLGPWETADVAVVPVTFPVAAVLDRAPEWHHVGDCVPSPWAPGAPRVGLWVRRAWFARQGRADVSLDASHTLY